GLAGAGVKFWTARVAIVIDASSFLVGAATAFWLGASEPQAHRVRRRRVVREASAGFALLRHQPLLRGITRTLLIANTEGGMSAAVFVLLFVGQIGIPPAQLGLVFVAS